MHSFLVAALVEDLYRHEEQSSAVQERENEAKYRSNGEVGENKGDNGKTAPYSLTRR